MNNINNIDEVKNKLEEFKKQYSNDDIISLNTNLMVIQNMSDKCISPEDREYEINDINKKLLYINLVDKVLQKLEVNEDWKEIDILLDLAAKDKYEEIFRLITLAHQLNRLYDMKIVLGLFADNRIEEFYQMCEFINPYNMQRFYTSMRILESGKSLSLPHMQRDAEAVQNLIAYTGKAGLSMLQAQEINKKYADGLVDNETDLKKILNEIHTSNLKLRNEHDEKIRFEKEMAKLKVTVPLNQDGDVATYKELNYFELEENFINAHHLVRINRDGLFKIYRWDDKTKRYVMVDINKTLATSINSYAYKKYGRQVEITASEIDKMVNRMFHDTVPLIEESSFLKSSSMETQIFFQNGYYDFEENMFDETDTKPYFHICSMPCNFELSAPEPVIFETMINQIFDGDETKIELLYQIIGAIISNIPLKNIYVFQGKSHGGKSTISEIISRLFFEDEIKPLGSMNELESKAKSFEARIKLLSIDDAPSDRWDSSTISYLKTRSRGINRKNETNFKILLSTNYPIKFKTENGRDESMENRIVVLPFEKDMLAASKNLSDNERQLSEEIKNYFYRHFENEKQGIVKKALLIFIKLRKNVLALQVITH